jgi:hypothetical protein
LEADQAEHLDDAARGFPVVVHHQCRSNFGHAAVSQRPFYSEIGDLVPVPLMGRYFMSERAKPDAKAQRRWDASISFSVVASWRFLSDVSHIDCNDVRR